MNDFASILSIKYHIPEKEPAFFFCWVAQCNELASSYEKRVLRG